MSAELPGLERLLADAAERHYGPRRRRLHVRLPRPAVVAAVVATAAAIALAVVLLPLGSDEQAATPRPSDDPAAALADRYAVFARPPQAIPRELTVLEDHEDSIDLSQPFSTRLLERSADGGVVAVAGTSTSSDERVVCLSLLRGKVGGGGCALMSDLVSGERPWFPFGTIGRYDDEVVALVPDAIDSVKIELASGATRNLPIENNLAYATVGQPVCQITWTTSAGDAVQERGEVFGAAEAENAVPAPPAC